jgi:hypothetical protein
MERQRPRQGLVSMPGKIYLFALLGVIALVTVVVVPSLFRKKCAKCGARNSLDAKECGGCGASFPEED